MPLIRQCLQIDFTFTITLTTESRLLVSFTRLTEYHMFIDYRKQAE